MPATLRKNLNLCFTRWEPPLSPQSPSPPFSATPTSTLIKNFNTLYDPTLHPSSSSSSSSSSTFSTSDAAAADLDLAAAFASQRFFFSSPGHSNSIFDSAPSVAAAAAAAPRPEPAASLVDDSVAVPTYSPDPYADFRRSMQEMVEARQLFDVKSDWDFLHELLLRYLALNPKSTHKFIVGAFADLLVSLMSQPRQRSGHGRVEYSHGGNGCKIFRRRIN
ncbi:transcription repressor OFP12-like isoform X2 [Rhodamnia argentea]|nr:transcription repressor OFP12-like isoform X2 [Rhodamnia argentea]